MPKNKNSQSPLDCFSTCTGSSSHTIGICVPSETLSNDTGQHKLRSQARAQSSCCYGCRTKCRMRELGSSGCRTKLPRLACILRNAAKCLAGSLPLQLHSSSMGPCRLASPDICTCDEQDPQPHTTTGSIWLEHAELLAMTSGHHIAYQSCVGQKFLSNNLESSWLIQ